MLNLPISVVESVIFMACIGIWAGFLFGGLYLGDLNNDQTRRMPRITRLLSSFTLVIGAWTWFAIAQGTPVDNFATGIAIGMTFGFMGDLFMAEVFSIEPHVLYGMLSFGIGHVAYIIGTVLVYLPEHPLNITAWVVILFWWLVATILWYFVVYRRTKSSFLVFAALPYAILLATTAGVVMNLTLMDSTFLLVTIGAILFLISDLLLAAQLFSRLHFKYISDIVWLLYGPGQMLIVFGIILYTIIDSLPIIP